MANAPAPFKLSISNNRLKDLHDRLDLTRFPDELNDVGRARGPPLADLARLVERWKTGYDWRRRETEINRLPQFTQPLTVQGFDVLEVHFVHQKSTVEGAIPLLFVHGWPGHYLEVEKILPLLTSASSEHPSFHVVAPSLPGFGFSEYPTHSGFGLAEYAEICHKLMLTLGYNQYVTQGGDWGQHITRIMAVKYGRDSVRACLSNYPAGFPICLLKNPIYYLQQTLSGWSDVEVARTRKSKWFSDEGRGYNLQQCTRPMTLGYSLADSPAGLLAWVFEKLVEWTDDYPWEDDEILDWVSIYWFSRAGPAASLHIYYERLHNYPEELKAYVNVPYGISLFPQEINQPSLPSIYAHHNVVFVGEHAHGGHFAAHEQPIELTDDLRKLFGKGGPAYGVVDGRDGY